MQTKPVIPSLPPLPPSLLSPGVTRLLLTQTSCTTRLTDPDSLAPEMLTVRATHITMVLRELLAEEGCFHVGINDSTNPETQNVCHR